VRKAVPLVYGVVSQIVGLGSLVYFGFWVYRAGVPKTVDSGSTGNLVAAVAIDTFLLAFFCFMHSILARSSVKSRMRRYVPHLYERATYCLLFGLLLFATCFAWRPLPAVLWRITSPAGVAAITTVFALGWIVHFGSLFWMGYGEFFGLRQMSFASRGEEYRPPAPMTRRDFAVSHILLIVSLMWIPFATPTMSVGQLYFAGFFALYDILGAWLSARDLSDVPAPVPNTVSVDGRAVSA